jgi:DNA-binding NarL/FixJ family response regulator
LVLGENLRPLRARIRALLERAGWDVVAEVANAERAVAVVAEATEAGLAPDVVLVDVRIPGGGIRAAAEITLDHPAVSVVMLAAGYDEDDLVEAVRAGAVGYLTTDGDPHRFADALRGVVEGRPALSPAMVARLLAEMRTAPGAPSPGGTRPDRRVSLLTPRELEVMALLRRGLGTAAVARQLFITPATVRVHVWAVLRKLKVKDRGLALRALDEQGWSDGPR